MGALKVRANANCFSKLRLRFLHIPSSGQFNSQQISRLPEFRVHPDGIAKITDGVIPVMRRCQRDRLVEVGRRPVRLEIGSRMIMRQGVIRFSLALLQESPVQVGFGVAGVYLKDTAKKSGGL